MPIVLPLLAVGRSHLGNPGGSQLRFACKLPGVLALGTTILVSFAEWVRRRGAQSDKASLEGL